MRLFAIFRFLSSFLQLFLSQIEHKSYGMREIFEIFWKKISLIFVTFQAFFKKITQYNLIHNMFLYQVSICHYNSNFSPVWPTAISSLVSFFGLRPNNRLFTVYSRSENLSGELSWPMVIDLYGFIGRCQLFKGISDILLRAQVILCHHFLHGI